MAARLFPLAAGIVLTITSVNAGPGGPKFHADDPLATIVDAEDASEVQARDVDLFADWPENLFSCPGDQSPNVRAQNVNTLDEVPDSTWFTNRLGTRAVTIDELLKGPDTVGGPAPGRWTVISVKNNGAPPRFTVRDTKRQVWFLKFDPLGYRGMATGTEVVVTKLFWALGYYVPEVHLAVLNSDNLAIGDGATITVPSGDTKHLTQSEIRALLRKAQREPDGSYRVVASKALPGRALGAFRFYGTRSDDPNEWCLTNIAASCARTARSPPG